MKTPQKSARVPGKAKGTLLASEPSKAGARPKRALKKSSEPSAGATTSAKRKAVKAAAVSSTKRQAVRGDSNEPASGQSASELIDQRIRDLDDWRGKTLARMRALILEADPQMLEEWKWRGTPVWSHNGIVCTGESYAKVVKLTFARGASVPDPARLFNASLEGNTRRAIDIPEGHQVDAGAFKALIEAAVVQNGPPKKKR